MFSVNLPLFQPQFGQFPFSAGTVSQARLPVIVGTAGIDQFSATEYWWNIKKSETNFP